MNREAAAAAKTVHWPASEPAPVRATIGAPGHAFLRYGGGLILSAALNAAVIYSLAQLDKTTIPDDDHEPHRVRPSVVKPPPPPPTDARVPASAGRANPVLPARPLMPSIELPALPDSLGLANLLSDGLDDVGLGDFTFEPAAESIGAPDAAADEPPQLTVPPDLTRFYPESARRRGLGGRSIVRVKVDATGRVVSAQVLSSEPQGLFDRAAVEAATRFTFSPARRGGRPVPGQTRLELKWRPRR